jgi:imidazoleglycerol phosphate synthase glutamine amidotransferase subunit HisH
MNLSNREYDTWKWFAQIFLPSLGTLYFAVAKIWGLPYAQEIVGTITAIDAFLGVCLGISSDNYYKSKKDGSSLDDKL